jgi:RNA-directed DNA polymerase
VSTDVERLARSVVADLRVRPLTGPVAGHVLGAVLGGHAAGVTRLARALVLRFAADRDPARRVIARRLRGRGFSADAIARALAALPPRDPPRRDPRAVEAYLLASRRFATLCARFARPLGELPPPAMLPAARSPSPWTVPALPTPQALADWLGVPMARLEAWCRRWRPDAERRDARLHHHHCRWLPRRNGPPRLLEVPKPALMAAQRRVLDGILAHVPAHAAAHGFVRARSPLTFTAPHAASACVLRLDVADCFASIGEPRVRRVFAALGYPADVARLLGALCTSATPRAALARGLGAHGVAGAALAERLRRAHLPQGAPTSPALANLALYGVDARLTGLARRFGARYTRYADDLLFSGDREFARGAKRCAAYAGAILLQQGLAVAHRKTRVMRVGARQHAAGLVLNVQPAVGRAERERLEAILVNCVRHGPSTQNRDGVQDHRAHLRGRVAQVAHANARHGAKLLAWFARIDWTR